MSFHSPAFERLTDPALLGRPDDARQFDLFGAAASPLPGPLLLSAPDTSGMAKDHRYRAMLPAVSVYSLPDHVLGSAGLLARDGSVFWRSDVLPGCFRDAFQPGATAPPDWLHGMRLPGVETLDFDEPLAVATHPNATYGSFLLEMLPRMYLLGLLRQMGHGFRLALTTRTPAWMEPLVALYFAPHEIVRYDSARQLVRAPAFVVPSMLNVGDYLHPAMNLMADDFLARLRAGTPPPATSPAGPLVYLSGQAGARGLLANGEAAAVLAELGFAVVPPASLSLRERMEVCANATCLLAEDGSDALFAPRGCKVVVRDWRGSRQGRIAALRGQALGVIEPAGVDPDALRHFIGEMVAIPATTPAPDSEVTPPPAKPPTTLSRLPLGDYLQQRQAAGSLPLSHVHGHSEIHIRSGFLYAEPIDRAVAAFGHLLSDPGYLDYTTAGVICAAFPGGAVLGGDGLVVADGRVIRDSTHSLEWWRAGSLVADANDDGAVRLKRPLDLPEPQPGAFFVGFSGGWRNHLNWLTECLPRLFLFNWLRARVPGLRLLLPDLPPGSLQQRCVELFAPDAVTPEPGMIVRVADGAAFVAQELWCASVIDVWGPPGLVREAAVACSGLVATDAAEQERRLPQRLYLRRGGSALVANAEELLPVLARHGFVTAVLDSMTLDQQVRLLRQARLVVGESGPGFADIMFCAPDTRVLEIFGPAGVVPTHWSLASLSKLGYGYLVGRHVPTAELPDSSDISQCRVEPEQLEAALHWLLLKA